MKALVFTALLAGCIPSTQLTATTQTLLTPAQSTQVIPHDRGDAEQLVIDKLSMRGFTLVERHATTPSSELRFLGNRDFRARTGETIGSVFYATITPVSPTATRVALVGKPTIDHRESDCTASDAPEKYPYKPCQPIRIYGNDWGITGAEEANVIRGVFAELALDATLATAAR